MTSTADQQAKAAKIADFGLAIYDSTDKLVYEHMWGSFTSDTRVAIASASKIVSGMVLFELIHQNELTLDSTTGDVLGWTGPNAAITLRHLLSFTSGLAPDATCTSDAKIQLADCVATIAATAAVAAPGTRFDYGSVHLQVAGRMAEVVSGKSWDTLFADVVATPLGLPADVTYFTAPNQMVGTTNPLLAGGLRTSMNEYAKLLRLVFHKGDSGGLMLGTPDIFDAQTKEPYPNAVIGKSPFQQVGHDYHYGLTAWLECATPATGCTTISSPGAFGWTPWLDRKSGYYAILGMHEVSLGGGGVVKSSVDLEQALEPLIQKILAN